MFPKITWSDYWQWSVAWFNPQIKFDLESEEEKYKRLNSEFLKDSTLLDKDEMEWYLQKKKQLNTPTIGNPDTKPKQEPWFLEKIWWFLESAQKMISNPEVSILKESGIEDRVVEWIKSEIKKPDLWILPKPVSNILQLEKQPEEVDNPILSKLNAMIRSFSWWIKSQEALLSFWPQEQYKPKWILEKSIEAVWWMVWIWVDLLWWWTALKSFKVPAMIEWTYWAIKNSAAWELFLKLPYAEQVTTAVAKTLESQFWKLITNLWWWAIKTWLWLATQQQFVNQENADQTRWDKFLNDFVFWSILWTVSRWTQWIASFLPIQKSLSIPAIMWWIGFSIAKIQWASDEDAAASAFAFMTAETIWIAWQRMENMKRFEEILWKDWAKKAIDLWNNFKKNSFNKWETTPWFTSEFWNTSEWKEITNIFKQESPNIQDAMKMFSLARDGMKRIRGTETTNIIPGLEQNINRRYYSWWEAWKQMFWPIGPGPNEPNSPWWIEQNLPIEDKTTIEEPIKLTWKEKLQKQSEALWYLIKWVKDIRAKKYLKNKLNTINTQINAYQPTQTDIKSAFWNDSIIQWAIDNLDKTNLSTEEIDLIKTAFQDIQNKSSVRITNRPWRMSNQQKAVFLKWEDYKTPFKKYEDIKIKQLPLQNFLRKNPWVKIDLIEEPRTLWWQKAFSMMWTKEKTYPTMMKPWVEKAIESGKDTYVEPFWWVGTSLQYLPEYFKKWLKKAEINYFDIEKYTIFKALKDWKWEEVLNAVDNSYNEIVDEITNTIKEDPTVMDILDWTKFQLWTKEFKEAVQIAWFYPSFAKKFFDEISDSKLQIKWELTQTFIDWLTKDIQKTIKENKPNLTETELQEVTDKQLDDVLSDERLFEKKYPELSNKINNVIGKYDNDSYVQNIKNIQQAMNVTIARHFRQRWTSGQRVLSPTEGFKNIAWVRNKVYNTLKEYKNTFDNYWDKINIYNEDEWVFRSKVTPKNAVVYLDPPYERTVWVYVKNNPALKETLGRYEDPKWIEEMIKHYSQDSNSMMLTNDISWTYFDAVKNALWDRMSNQIFWYQEWVTPTSFISTSDIEKNPKEVTPFIYNKNSKILDASKLLTDKLIPDIANSLKKKITKILQNISPEMQKTIDKLSNTQRWIEQWAEQYRLLEQAINEVTSWQEKQKILNEAKKLLRQTKITWWETLKIYNTVTKLYEDRQKIIQNINSKINDFRKDKSVDIKLRKDFAESFDQKFLQRKITQAEKKIILDYKIVVDKILQGQDITTEEAVLLYEATEKWIDKIENKKSMFDMTIDELKLLEKDIDKNIEYAKDEYKYNKWLESKDLEEKINYAKNKYNKPSDSNIDKFKFMDNTKNWINSDFFFSSRWLWFIKDQFIQKPDDVYIRELNSIEKEFSDKIEKLNLRDKNFIKIWLHALTQRWDGKWITKLMTYFTEVGDPFKPAPLQKYLWKTLELKEKYNYISSKELEEYKKELSKKKNILNEEKEKYNKLKKEAILKYINEVSKSDYLTKEENEMYKWMQEKFDSIFPEVVKTLYDTKNNFVSWIENYFPIVVDWKNMSSIKDIEEPDLVDVQTSLYKYSKVEDWFTKKATNAKVIPVVNAKNIFLKHMNDALFYKNFQKPLTTMSKVVNGLKDNLTAEDYIYMKKYIDLSKKKWKTTYEYLTPERLIEKLIVNTKKFAIAWNFTSAVVQFTNLLDATLIYWFPLKWIMEIMSGKKRDWKSIYKWVSERSNTIKFRDTEDFIVTVDWNLENFIKSKWQAITKLAFLPIWFADKFTWVALFVEAYDHAIKNWYWESEASLFADRIVRMAIGSARWKDLSEALLKHNKWWKSFFLAFQTFVINRANILNYAWRYWKETPENKADPFNKQKYIYAKSLNNKLRVIYVLWLALVMEEILRWLINEYIYKKPQSWWLNIAMSPLSLVPGLQNLFNVGRYWMPVLSDATNMVNTIMSKKQKLDEKFWKLAFYMAQLSWMPGWLQLKKIWESYSKKSKKETTTSKWVRVKFKPKINQRKVKINTNNLIKSSSK